MFLFAMQNKIPCHRKVLNILCGVTNMVSERNRKRPPFADNGVGESDASALAKFKQRHLGICPSNCFIVDGLCIESLAFYIVLFIVIKYYYVKVTIKFYFLQMCY